MRKYIFTILIIASLILVIGQGCEKKPVEQATSPFIGGSQGIVPGFEAMGVVENGIQTIWEGESFPLAVNTKNKGEEDIAPGNLKVTLKGISMQDLTGVGEGAKQNSNTIEKVSDVNPDGGEETVNFGDAKYAVPITGRSYDLNIYADVVYRYATFVAIPQVCFNGDQSDTTICTVDEAKTVFSSGAPVLVKTAEEKPAGTGIIALLFNVENVGGGHSTIPGQEFDPRFDQISYVLTPQSEVDRWDCTSGGKTNEAKLVDEKATVRCKLKDTAKLSQDTLYTKQIGLKITYDYKNLISTQLRIKKP